MEVNLHGPFTKTTANSSLFHPSTTVSPWPLLSDGHLLNLQQDLGVATLINGVIDLSEHPIVTGSVGFSIIRRPLYSSSAGRSCVS